MKKTTVYLHEEDLATIRRLAARSGRSQAEIIRGAVAAAAARARRRHFRSHGVAAGTGEAIGRDADHLVRRAIGHPKEALGIFDGLYEPDYLGRLRSGEHS